MEEMSGPFMEALLWNTNLLDVENRLNFELDKWVFNVCTINENVEEKRLGGTNINPFNHSKTLVPSAREGSTPVVYNR